MNENPTTMRAMLLHRCGPPENMQLAEIPRPECEENQLLVRVRAAGVNPVDWKIRNGSLRPVMPPRLPFVLGFDVAGEIVQVGTAAQQRGWKVGEEVLCFLDRRYGGGYAEYAAADAGATVRKPASITFEEAAGIPLAASTALQGIRDLGKLQAGQELLVNGASGGVGSFAVQLGKILGATVTGVCGESNLDFVRGLGADITIDYRKDDFTSMDRKYDVIFDAAAKCTYSKCRRTLKGRGRYVTTIPSAQNMFYQFLTKLTGRRCLNILVRRSGEDLRWLVQMIEKGKLRSVVQQVLPLREAATAHHISQTGHGRGKLILSMEAE